MCFNYYRSQNKVGETFFAQKLLNVIGVIYLKYWLIPKKKYNFSNTWPSIQAHFKHPKVIKSSNTFVRPLVNLVFFNQQFALFQSTMKNYCKAMLPPLDYNPNTCLWEKLGSNNILNHQLSKWFNYDNQLKKMVPPSDTCTTTQQPIDILG